MLKVENMMAIKYKTKHVAKLMGDFWEGMKSGIDDYPTRGRFSSYFIAGGDEANSGMF